MLKTRQKLFMKLFHKKNDRICGLILYFKISLYLYSVALAISRLTNNSKTINVLYTKIIIAFKISGNLNDQTQVSEKFEAKCSKNKYRNT